MWLRWFSGLLAVVGLMVVAFPLPVDAATPVPEKNTPAPESLSREATIAKDASKAFFTLEAALPPEEWNVQLRGLPSWSQQPNSTWMTHQSGETFSLTLLGSSSADLPFQAYSSGNTYPNPAQMLQTLQAVQAWQQHQQYRLQVYQQWRASQARTGGGVLLPGMGGTAQGDACNPIAHFAMLNAQLHLGRKPGGPGFIPSQCFVAGTLVAASVGAQHLQPIERFQVGERIGEMAETTAAITPLAWRRLELRAARQDGTFTEVVLLRPLAWLEERRAVVGSKIHLTIPGCGFTGTAEVMAISLCPVIQPGQGAVITGTIRHEAALVVDLFVEGQAQPIGTTVNHRFWSEDRQEFVRADELRMGERLRGLNGSYRFVRLQTRPAPEPVFNLEVQGVGAFHVSPVGLLARDAGTAR